LVKRGLVISYYFPPAGGGGVQRWIKLIKYLSRWNWQFTVITAQIEPSMPQDESLLQEITDDTKIIRGEFSKSKKTFLNSIYSKLKHTYWQRWLSAFIHISDSRKKWNKVVQPLIFNELNKTAYQAIIVTIPPYSLAEIAAILSLEQKIPVFIDLRDPWTTNPYKIHPTFWHLNQDRKIEHDTISRVKHVISAYQSTVTYLCNSSITTDKHNFLILPNGFDEEDFQKIKSTVTPKNKRFELGFSGTFYSHLNHPRYLFKAIGILKKEKVPVYFNHIGTSTYDLNKLAKEFDIQDQVIQWGYHDHVKCLKILAEMDAFCLILDEKIRNADATVGSKLYEYLRFKKPILSMVPKNGEAAQIIHQTNSGVVCSSFDSDEIASVLKNMVLAKHMYTFQNIDQFSRENQALALKSFLEKHI
jgi:glycosyltransferase involved in cell wall biosynthesis